MLQENSFVTTVLLPSEESIWRRSDNKAVEGILRCIVNRESSGYKLLCTNRNRVFKAIVTALQAKNKKEPYKPYYGINKHICI